MTATATGAAQLKLSGVTTPLVERASVVGGGDVSITQFATTPANIPQGAIFRNSSGKTIFASNPGDSNNRQLAVEVTSGELVFNTTQNLAAISVAGSGAIAKMAQDGKRVLVTDSLSVSGGGKLDLYDNDMILKATAATELGLYNALYTLVDSGYNNGNWFGTGVMSTTASLYGGARGLGLVRNSQLSTVDLSRFTTFSGQAVNYYDILVKYTYRDDLDLNAPGQ